MKAYLKGNKIVLSKTLEYKEIEKNIQLLSKDFEKLKNICEDRTSEEFPVEIIKRIIEKIIVLEKSGKEIEIPENFIQFIKQEKNVLKYFEMIVNKAKEEEMKYKRKIENLKRLSEQL